MMPKSRVGVKQTQAPNQAVMGFSLIEALLVMVLLGLLAAIIAPAFTSGYRSIVLKSTVRTVAATLRYVRATAIGSGEKRALEFDLQNKEFSAVQTAGKSAQSQTVAGFLDLYEADAPSTVTEEQTQPVVFEFFPSGGSNGHSLVLAYRHKRYLIDVSPLTGKVKVSVPIETVLRIKPENSTE